MRAKPASRLALIGGAISVCILVPLLLFACAAPGPAPTPRADAAPEISLGVPRHLTLARELVREVPPEQTTYQHVPTEVRWGSAGVAPVCRADCSGLVNEALKKSLGLNDDDLRSWLKRDRPLALDYFRAISDARGFQRIESFHDAAPGDLIAIRYERGSGNSGHVMIVDAPPEPAAEVAPLIHGTTQWRVHVIDSSSTGHGPGDTRFVGAKRVRSGLGEGDFRVYLDQGGRVAGHTFTTASDAPFRSQSERPIAIGRVLGPKARPRRRPYFDPTAIGPACRPMILSSTPSSAS